MAKKRLKEGPERGFRNLTAKLDLGGNRGGQMPAGLSTLLLYQAGRPRAQVSVLT